MKRGQIGKNLVKNTKGILIYAKNNEQLDYIKQADIATRYAKHWLNVPVSIVCDEKEQDKINTDLYDQVIPITFETDNTRFVYDKNKRHEVSYFNYNRIDALEMSPYYETLMIDSDYLIRNNILNQVWRSNYNFMVNSTSSNIMLTEEALGDRFVADGSVPVFWATVMYFKKSDFINKYYEKLKMVRDDYEFYFRSYQISNMMYRNDFVFSIAYHLMFDNSNEMPIQLPTKQLNVPMEFEIGNVISDTELEIRSETNLINSTSRNLHIMNKFSLERKYDELIGVL